MQYILLCALSTLLSFSKLGVQTTEKPQPNATLCPGAIVSVKVFLEGPYLAGTGKMSDALRSGGYLPTTEPYGSFPYAYSTVAPLNLTGFIHVTSDPILGGGGGGGEFVPAAVSPATLSTIFLPQTNTGDNIVDWVFLELRNTTTNVLATKSALLQADGDVVSVDGVSPVTFSTVSCGSYFVGVRHRNHLAARTLTPVTLNNTGTTIVDFTAATGTLALGVGTLAVAGATDARVTVTLASGVAKALPAGDIDNSNVINVNDGAAVWNARNSQGYQKTNCTMGGTVNVNDGAKAWNNRNKTNQ
jgi:hypothetical protein